MADRVARQKENEQRVERERWRSHYPSHAILQLFYFENSPPTLSLVQSYKCVGGCYPSRCNTNNHMTENIQGKRTRQREVPLPHGTGKAQGWKRENERRQEGARIHKQKRSGARWDAGSPSISCPPSRKKLQRLHNQLDKSASAPVASFPRSKSTTRTFTCALDRLLVKVSPWPRPESTGSSGWDDLQFKKNYLQSSFSKHYKIFWDQQRFKIWSSLPHPPDSLFFYTKQ